MSKLIDLTDLVEKLKQIQVQLADVPSPFTESYKRGWMDAISTLYNQLEELESRGA